LLFFFDEFWGLIDENWKSDVWKKYIRLPTYFLVVIILLLGLCLTIATHISWITYPPQSIFGHVFFPKTEFPCSSPSRIATLLTILCFLLLITEITEAIYNVFGPQEEEDDDGKDDEPQYVKDL